MTAGAPATSLESGPVVSNASPLIALAQIGRLTILRDLFERVLVPPAAVTEVAPQVPSLPPWIVLTPIARGLPPMIQSAGLGAGEAEAIALAAEQNARALIVDDKAARRVADAMGLPLTGTLGVLLAGRRRGFVPSIRQCLDDLDAYHFHVAPKLREHVLRDAGEVP